jgi:hypothetical protein
MISINIRLQVEVVRIVWITVVSEEHKPEIEPLSKVVRLEPVGESETAEIEAIYKVDRARV